jgi:hypothetical protein
VVGALLTSPVLAQTDVERAGARAAATEGAQAFTEGRWSDAADLFARAEGVVHSPVHVLYLARSYEKLGHLVKAREAYLRIINEAIPPNAPDPWREAKVDAERERAALEPRVPYLTIKVRGAPTESVRVTIDGTAVVAAFVGVPQPIDPGEHGLRATADGKADAVAKIAIAEGRRETVVLTLTDAGASGMPHPAAAPAGGQTDRFAPAHANGGGGVSPLTWATFGVGAVGLGVGTVFALKTSSKLDEADSLCNLPSDSGGRACPDTERSRVNALDDDARSAKTLATIGFVAGGLGVAAGVTLLLLSPEPKRAAGASTNVQPWASLGAAGLRGRF